ncbi:hypothetical protein SALBM311S_03592 [Streptomyces alboniger]
MFSFSLPFRTPGRSSFAVRIGFAVATGVLAGALGLCALPHSDSRQVAEAATFGDVGWNVAGPRSAA